VKGEKEMKRKGMTLIELLVVIGLIIFIVTTFIFPAYERARGRATEVVCVSNLRQIGQALLMYAQDHDGFVPPYSTLGAPYYSEVLRDKEINLRPLQPRLWKMAFDPYIRDKGILFCPHDPFAGLSPDKTPCQGLPPQHPIDCTYARRIDHSITSYMTLIERDYIQKGYLPTTDIYVNISNSLKIFWSEWSENFPPNKEIPPPTTKDILDFLHNNAAVYMQDRIHFIDPEIEQPLAYIELFYDGHVDFHGLWKHWLGQKCFFYSNVIEER
jgi:competence protein ComGC